MSISNLSNSGHEGHEVSRCAAPCYEACEKPRAPSAYDPIAALRRPLVRSAYSAVPTHELLRCRSLRASKCIRAIRAADRSPPSNARPHSRASHPPPARADAPRHRPPAARLFGFCAIMRRDHAGQNVARAAGRHSRIARRIDPGFAIRLNHQRPVPLEHNDQFMLACKLPRHAQPIFLHVGGRTSRQPRHLSRMRRDHQHPALAAQFVRRAPRTRSARRRRATMGIFAPAHQSSHQLAVSGSREIPGPIASTVFPFDQRVQIRSLALARNRACVAFLAKARSSARDEIRQPWAAQTSASPPLPDPLRRAARPCPPSPPLPLCRPILQPPARARRLPLFDSAGRGSISGAKSRAVITFSCSDETIASSGEPIACDVRRPRRSAALKTCAGRGAVKVTIESARAISPCLRTHRVGIGAGRNIDGDHRRLARVQQSRWRRHRARSPAA